MDTRLEIAAMVSGSVWEQGDHTASELAHDALWLADALIKEHERTKEQTHVEAGVETKNIRVLITADEYRLIRRLKDCQRATGFLDANGFLRAE